MAKKAHTLRSTVQQKVFDEQNTIAIEPAVPQVVNVPYYDPRVAFGQWPHSVYPPLWWTPPRGYAYGPDVGFMTGVAVSAIFWRNGFDWRSKRIYVDNEVTYSNFGRVDGVPWFHDPLHRRSVSYSTSELRDGYGRGFTPGYKTRWSFRGYDTAETSRPAGSPAKTHGSGPAVRRASLNPVRKRHLVVFEGLGDGALVRLFSARGNASILADARNNNSNVAMRDRNFASSVHETRLVAIPAQ
jgi:hypothetical protein